jgi:RNA polymerase sigma-70 factor (ECF subfamily)
MIPTETDEFEAHRRYLFGVAYRMLGSSVEAEDMVQEAYLRWQRSDRAEVRSPRAFLSTVVTRLCLDRLKEARSTRESYVGPWLPEPIRTDAVADVDPLEHTESISLAFLVLLERLTPLERAVYLLHEVFEYSHSEIAAIVDRDEAACRQILRRARKDIVAGRPRFAPSKSAHQRLLEGFADAVVRGDADGLERLLADDVRSLADSGGKVNGAARRPVTGRDRVIRLYLGLRRLLTADTTAEVVDLNGWPALVLRVGGAVVTALQIEADGERIHTIHSTVNPEKLGRL